MISALIVADDLTGAHASAATLRGSAAPASVAVVAAEATCDQREMLAGLADIVVLDTGTRNTGRARAVEAVREALGQWWPAAHVAKRIDSTLRGHIGAEVGCVVRELARLSGRRVLGLVCPAHPSAGRTTVGGRQRLHGLRLNASSGSQAAIEPLNRSRILPLLRADGGLRGSEVNLAAVRRGADQELAAALRDGLDVVVFDSETPDDVDRLAATCAAFAERHPDLVVVSVDPGPFTERLYHHREVAGLDVYRAGDPDAKLGTTSRCDVPVLAVVGSASDLTRRQVRTLMDRRTTWPVGVVDLAPSGARVVRSAGDVVRELAEAAEAAKPGEAILVTTVDEHGLDADPSLSESLPRILGQVVRSFLESARVAGLVLTGGDVAAGVLASLDAVGVRPVVELAPLAVQGTMLGGPWSGLPLVTKGGLVGDDETLLRCVNHLAAGATSSAQARPVPLT